MSRVIWPKFSSICLKLFGHKESESYPEGRFKNCMDLKSVILRGWEEIEYIKLYKAKSHAE